MLEAEHSRENGSGEKTVAKPERRQIIAKMPNMYNFYFFIRRVQSERQQGIESSVLSRGVDSRVRCHLYMHHCLLLLTKILLLRRRVHHLLLILLSIGRGRVASDRCGLTAREWCRLP